MRRKRHLVLLGLCAVIIWSLLSFMSRGEIVEAERDNRPTKRPFTKPKINHGVPGRIPDGEVGIRHDTKIPATPESSDENKTPMREDFEQLVGVIAPAQVAKSNQDHQFSVNDDILINNGIQFDAVANPLPTLSLPDKELHNKFSAIRDHLMELENLTIQNKYYIPKSQRDNEKVKPYGNEIVIVSACDGPGATGGDSQLLSMALENRDSYANAHRYTHYFVNTTKFKTNENREVHPVWFKISALREALKENPSAQWVWWLDMDAIIMNPEIDLAEHLLHPHVLEQRLTYDRPINNIGDVFTGLTYKSRGQVQISDIDFIFAQDYVGINAGSFFLRRSEFSSFVLNIWDSPKLINFNFPRLEQDAFIYLLNKYKAVYDHTALVPQRLLNSYHTTNTKAYNKFWPGDLAIHFAGKSKTIEYRELWDTYWEIRGSSV